MCGASDSQKRVEAAQENMYTTLTAHYNEIFADFKAISGSLTSALAPIVAGGPGQLGFAPAELTALNTAATERVAEQYGKASVALGERQAAEQGSDFVPSGQREAQAESLVTAAAGETSREENQILQSDYAAGRENYWRATSALAGVAGMENPIGFANAATGAGSAAAKTADEIAQAGNAWIAPVLGMVGAVGGAAVGRIPTGGGGGGGGDDINV